MLKLIGAENEAVKDEKILIIEEDIITSGRS